MSRIFRTSRIAVVAYTGEMLETPGHREHGGPQGRRPERDRRRQSGRQRHGFVHDARHPERGTYIDGIWQVSNNGLLLREFVDLDRVEVLRGPQGTLYGRDSTGGAIRLYTKPPSTEYGVQVDMAVGNLDRRDVKGALDLPLTENSVRVYRR